MWALYQEIKHFYVQKTINKEDMKRLAFVEKKLLGYSTEIVTLIENTLEY
jgi:hypothetical protein